MSQPDRDDPPNQAEFVVVDAHQSPFVFMNSDSEIFICADSITKIVPAQQIVELDGSGQ